MHIMTKCKQLKTINYTVQNIDRRVKLSGSSSLLCSTYVGGRGKKFPEEYAILYLVHFEHGDALVGGSVKEAFLDILRRRPFVIRVLE